MHQVQCLALFFVGLIPTVLKTMKRIEVVLLKRAYKSTLTLLHCDTYRNNEDNAAEYSELMPRSTVHSGPLLVLRLHSQSQFLQRHAHTCTQSEHQIVLHHFRELPAFLQADTTRMAGGNHRDDQPQFLIRTPPFSATAVRVLRHLSIIIAVIA